MAVDALPWKCPASLAEVFIFPRFLLHCLITHGGPLPAMERRESQVAQDIIRGVIESVWPQHRHRHLDFSSVLLRKQWVGVIELSCANRLDVVLNFEGSSGEEPRDHPIWRQRQEREWNPRCSNVFGHLILAPIILIPGFRTTHQLIPPARCESPQQSSSWCQ